MPYKAKKKRLIPPQAFIFQIIIIDYIDMHIEQNKQRILKIFEEELKKDSSKVQIEGFTKLNLLELTRKHVYTI